MAWPRSALGDVATIVMGQAPKGDTYNETGAGWPLIAGAGDFGNSVPAPKKFTVKPTRLTAPGDIVLGIRASIGEKVLADGEYCLGRGVAGLRVGPHLNDRYLWHWLSASVAQLAAKGRGATFLQVNRTDIAELQIPLPPVEEQRRIAAILDAADELRDKRRKSIALLDSLAESIFLSMFGRSLGSPVTVGRNDIMHREGWHWEPLGDVARLATGHTPDRNAPEYWYGDIPWINLTEIRELDGALATDTKLRITQAGVDNSSAVILPAGTVCFSRTASIGFVTVMGRSMATSQDFVNWVCGDRILPQYLMHALLRSREQLRALSTGSTHKTIYMRVAEQFHVLVPPLELQHAFVSQVRRLAQHLQRTHDSGGAIDKLFASLQQRAFRGEL